MVEIVAEISGNHGGSLNRALELIWEAAYCGCDYVKFQYYHPLDMPDLLEGNNTAMYNQLHVPSHWLPEMFLMAHKRKIGLFASVFSAKGARELLEYDIPFIKIASRESTLLSDETYNSIIEEIPPEVEIIWSRRGPHPRTHERKLLYCPEGHPPTITWDDFSDFRRGNYYGFSDHTKGIRVPLAFIRAGAQMIEKHFKLEYDNLTYENLPIDNAFSADPYTMKLLCKLAHNQ